MVMLTGSTVHPCPAWALTEPVNITPRSTYHRQITTRDRRIQTPTTPSIVKRRFLARACSGERCGAVRLPAAWAIHGAVRQSAARAIHGGACSLIDCL